MTTHKAVHVARANAPLTLVDVETTRPGPWHVRIAVAACGVCGTDLGFVSGGFPNMTWPLTLGHEIAGTVAELGDGVDNFAVGARVAVDIRVDPALLGGMTVKVGSRMVDASLKSRLQRLQLAMKSTG